MQDPELEKKIEEVKQLIQIWHQFYNILIAVFADAEEMDRLDADFQKIKTTIAQKHPILMAVVTKDDYIAQTVLATVRRTISLHEFKRLSGLEINKVMIEWHDANVLLNETLGHLEYERDSLVDKSAAGKRTEESMARMRDRFDAIRRNPYMKIGVRLVIAAIIVGGVYIYREEITANQYYIKYLKPSIDWVGETTGLNSLFGKK